MKAFDLIELLLDLVEENGNLEVRVESAELCPVVCKDPEDEGEAYIGL